MSSTLQQPIPQGSYIPAIRHANLIYTSGMTPRLAGKLIYSGKIKVTDPLELHRDAVRLATLNAINAAQGCLQQGEKISFIPELYVFINTETEFTSHSKIADFASDLLSEKLGRNCLGSRAAIGVSSLPSNAIVEIKLTAAIG